MKNIKKSIILSLLIALLIPCVAHAEGMLSYGGNSKYQSWAYLTGKEDENGWEEYLTNQWKQVWGYWYYFDESGRSLYNAWKEIDGKWYYFDQWSVMQHDTTTPDGYYVGSDGAWIPEATESNAARE